MNDNYEDIINIEHFEMKHKRMGRIEKASQFAPFAALTGYEDNIEEAKRLTDSKITLSEEEKAELNEKVKTINSHIIAKPLITVTYFVRDSKKSGGRYITETKNVKFIDEVYNKIKFTDNKMVSFDDIYYIKEHE